MTKEQILQELEFCIEGYSDFIEGKIGIGCFSNYVSALACVLLIILGVVYDGYIIVIELLSKLFKK